MSVVKQVSEAVSKRVGTEFRAKDIAADLEMDTGHVSSVLSVLLRRGHLARVPGTERKAVYLGTHNPVPDRSAFVGKGGAPKATKYEREATIKGVMECLRGAADIIEKPEGELCLAVLESLTSDLRSSKRIRKKAYAVLDNPMWFCEAIGLDSEWVAEKLRLVYPA